MVRDSDHEFMKLAVEEARRSQHKNGRIHPHVGAVVVTRDGVPLGRACHGETSDDGEPPHCDHAEYIVLERKLPKEKLRGCTVYTTLEPCTYRNPPKVPCVERLIDRHVGRVVIGMLDPNQMITGKGVMALRKANIAVDLFPPDLMEELEELNREFVRQQTVEHLSYVACHGTKYHVPDSAQFWNDLLERAEHEFILVGNSNKSWFKRDEEQSRRLGAAICRILEGGGRVVIISGTDRDVVTNTRTFISTHVTKRLNGNGVAKQQLLRDRFLYAQAERVNYSAVLSDDRLLIMPRLNSREFAAEAMVLELTSAVHASQFKHYKDDINRVIVTSRARNGR